MPDVVNKPWPALLLADNNHDEVSACNFHMGDCHSTYVLTHSTIDSFAVSLAISGCSKD
jgi:hypothetical protein